MVLTRTSLPPALSSRQFAARPEPDDLAVEAHRRGRLDPRQPVEQRGDVGVRIHREEQVEVGRCAEIFEARETRPGQRAEDAGLDSGMRAKIDNCRDRRAPSGGRRVGGVPKQRRRRDRPNGARIKLQGDALLAMRRRQRNPSGDQPSAVA